MSSVWLAFHRGLLFGLIGGVLAGIIEAIGMLTSAPVMRAALLEAGLYAIVVDGLLCAGVAALASILFAVVLLATRRRLSPHSLAALHVAGATAIVILLAGLLWAFRENGADPTWGVPTPIVLSILLLACGVGALAYPLARTFAGAVVRGGRGTAIAGLLAAGVLALVFPVQIVLETQQHMRPTEPSTQGAQLLDPSLLTEDLRTDLELGLGDSLARGAASSSSQPNVLLITVDALRADHVGACGNPWIKTPTLDLLASYSAVGCNAYTHQPQTNPALASLFTSTYPQVHGVRVHMVDRLADSFDTIAEVLQRNGYTTSAVIPWTSLEPAFSGFHQGFHTYEAFVVNEPPTLKNPATAALAGIYRRVTDQVALGGAVESVLGMRQGTEAEIDGRADVSATASLNWLANNGNSHFFLWVHFFDPHYPWTPPEPWDQLYDQGYEGRYDGGMGFVYEMRAGVFYPEPRDVQYLRALYASEVSYADHYIGQVLGYMARTGLLQNTIVLVTADHGESLGERGTSWPNGDYWLHGDDLYTPGIRVPLIVYDPRSTRGHQDISVPLQHVDVMPTILDLVGVPVPRQAQGRSIVPLLTGAESGADRTAITTVGDDSLTSVVSADGWKMIVDRKTGARELYYLPGDAEELNNVARQYPDRVAALSRQLDSWAQANQSGLASRANATGGG